MSRCLLLTAVLVTAVCDQLEWRWSKDKASLDYSAKQHLKDYDVKIDAGNFKTILTVFTKGDGKKVLSHEGHKHTVFCRAKDTLYVAEFPEASFGCDVVAFDLKTGKQLWKTELRAIGPVNHTEYWNLINIETDGRKIIVCGNEAYGRYVEHLDIKTGKTIANKTFKAEIEP